MPLRILRLGEKAVSSASGTMAFIIGPGACRNVRTPAPIEDKLTKKRPGE